MKLGGTSCISHEISENSLGTQHGFYMKITETNSKEMQKEMLYLKKALSPRTATVEMKIQRTSELVDTSCKSNEVSQNGLGDTTCFLRRPFQIPEQPTVEKLFKVIWKHKRVQNPVMFPDYFKELQEMTVNVQKN